MLAPLPRRHLIHVGFITINILWLFLLAGCSNESQPLPEPEKSHPKVVHKNGYTIPKLASAREQLNFALSRVSDYRERKTALKLVGELFPAARMEKAEASLELAYLSLGKDFRLAGRQECLDTVAKYESIIDQYQDFPPICAKARWYIAWIYMDLLHDKERGINNYWRVVREYPHEGFLPAPHLRWQEIFARQAKRETTFLSAREQWAAIALLELARNIDDPKERLEAVEELVADYPASRAVMYGLMILLDQRPVCQKAIEMTKAYLSSGVSYPPLAIYLKRKLEDVTLRLARPGE